MVVDTRLSGAGRVHETGSSALVRSWKAESGACAANGCTAATATAAGVATGSANDVRATAVARAPVFFMDVLSMTFRPSRAVHTGRTRAKGWGDARTFHPDPCRLQG